MIKIHYRSCQRCGKIIKKEDICECVKNDSERIRKRNEYAKNYADENPEIVKPLKTQQWKRLRKNIINRDGGYCQRCKNLLGVINSKNLEVHHIIPRVEKPELIFEPTNLITLCSDCNKVLGVSGKLDFKPDNEPKDRDYLIF